MGNDVFQAYLGGVEGGGGGDEGGSSGGVVMDAGCYVPNNPSHFGLELLPPAPGPGGWPPSPSSPPHAHDEMAAAFQLPTLELDTALFPFSPQAGGYK